jgi:hypothetical protein
MYLALKGVHVMSTQNVRRSKKRPAIATAIALLGILVGFWGNEFMRASHGLEIILPVPSLWAPTQNWVGTLIIGAGVGLLLTGIMVVIFSSHPSKEEMEDWSLDKSGFSASQPD